MTWSINSPFGGLSSSDSQVGYALLTHSQVAIIQNRNSVHAAPLLACVKPVASVHPEPGSNSPLYNISFTNSRNRITPARSFVIYLILLKTPNSIREINDIFLSTVRILLPRNHISFSGSDRQKRGLRSLVLLSLFYVSLSKNTLFFLSRFTGIFTPSFPKASAKLQPSSLTNQIFPPLFSDFFQPHSTPT